MPSIDLTYEEDQGPNPKRPEVLVSISTDEDLYAATKKAWPSGPLRAAAIAS